LLKFAVDFTSVVVAGLCAAAVLLIAILFFCVIRFHAVLHPLVLLWMLGFALTMLIIMVILVTMAINIRVESETSYDSYQRFDLSCRKVDRLYWKSCQPLKIKVWEFGYIYSHGFLLMLFRLIQELLVNLLLGTRQ